MRNECYCWNDKKKFSKVCVACSNKINKLRSLSKHKSEKWIESKKQLDIILEQIENFNK